MKIFPLILLISVSAVFAVDYSYDANNRLVGATYANGVSITYAYDDASNLESVTYHLGD